MKLLLLYLLLLPQIAFAAIADVADTTSHAATDNARTPTEPAGAIEDDLIFAFCTISSSEDGSWTDPGDYTEIDQVTMGANIPGDSYIGYKVRGSGAGSGYTFTYSGTADNIRCSLQAFRGNDVTTPIDVTYVQGSHYNENDQDAALTPAEPITTVSDDAWVCLFQWNWDGNITTGMPTGYTEYMFAESANRTQVIACKAVASAGLETPGAWTHTDVQSGADSINYTIAIAPVAAASASSLFLLRN